MAAIHDRIAPIGDERLRGRVTAEWARATRKRICQSLAMLKDKKLDNPWRKHGDILL